MVKARIPQPVEFIDGLKRNLHTETSMQNSITQGLSSEEKTEHKLSPTNQPANVTFNYYTALFLIGMDAYVNSIKNNTMEPFIPQNPNMTTKVSHLKITQVL